MNKILIIEDEPSVLEAISAYLRKEGYEVYTAERGYKGLEYTEDIAFDLIILDLMLPDISGEEICKRIRAKSNTYIFMLTAKSSLEERIRGLDLGADEYLVKPFSPREIVARVNALFRRIKDIPENKNVVAFNGGELVIDHDKREVRLRGDEVALTPIEFDILTLLSENPGIVLSRETLIDRVLGPDFEGVDRTIDVHIKNIRKKIELDTKNPSYIITVFKLGYKFGGGQ
ncbi:MULTISPECIES: response regulator transcription factor [Proteiniclasticum]|uniref:Stage 0 sporulation protein A homolog n=1 Tax=Proteiniclasticum ruminis TaxID=398199 RepID=A0A1I4XUM4_9CLOT|nr:MULTISPECIES: response regulator transcription factor [Proteiniclasticum]SFN29514.1 DNA-binding response regulator, OmpR family, contains REC and winged-helix (wHTH) domain [Proteiniclasticum ruminis]HBW14507.1 DNA-binding response regulator [Proteiniclasticum sp.]